MFVTVDRFIALVREYPEVGERLAAAGSREERAAIVAEFGVELPDDDALRARLAEMNDLDGIAGGAASVLY